MEIVMPRLSDTMEEGTILRWLKQDGEQVARGEELVEIETDKATMVYESDAEGTLQIVADEGATLPVGQLIAHIGAAGEVDGPAPEGPAGGAAAPADTGAVGVAGSGGGETASNGAASPAPAGSGSSAPREADTERIKASPLARRLARERGVELAALHGSGPGGRIVKADVESARSPAASVAGVATAKGETTTEPLNRTQQTIARRMAESKATIPDFSIVIEVDMEACVELRTELKRLGGDPVPTYNDMVVKACALALREHPRVNGSYRDAALELHSRVNVGVAVAAENALVVPTVFDADLKALGEIARETRSLAGRVRDATITPPELGGGTFTVSNLGMYGVRSFNAIINPPQAAIMSVGALERRAVVLDDGTIAPRNTLALTLVCDHRILYGADAAEFAARVRELLQTPASLTL